MEIPVKAKALSDKPYQGESGSIFTFNDIYLNNFVSEIVYGNQTCYLVSGYRGAGKTSFINRTKQLVEQQTLPRLYSGENRNALDKEKDGSIKPESFDPVFVYTSFAKYNSHTAFLKQLIRSMFLAFDSVVPEIGHARTHFLNPEFKEKFAKLNKRTFFDVKDQHELSKEDQTQEKYSIEASVKEIGSAIANIVVPIIPASLAGFASNFPDFPIAISIGMFVLSVAWMGFGFFKLSKAQTITKKTIEKSTTNELYDDEIAYHFMEQTLDNLKKEGFKVVFVLDELDKVEDDQITKLINEMKPYLLSGRADYVVVAGQSLTYKYLSASSVDDAVISSLFSKTFHVPLKDVSELYFMVKNHIIDSKSSTDEVLLNQYIYHHIYISKQVPRTLMNQIRQELSWSGNNAKLIIESKPIYVKHSNIVNAIESIVRDQIDPHGYRPVVRDYLIAQLYRTAHILEKQERKPISFAGILEQFEKSDLFYHAYYFNALAPCLAPLVKALKDILSLDVTLETLTADIKTQQVPENIEEKLVDQLNVEVPDSQKINEGQKENVDTKNVIIQGDDNLIARDRRPLNNAVDMIIGKTLEAFRKDLDDMINIVRKLGEIVLGGAAPPAEVSYTLVQLKHRYYLAIDLPDAGIMSFLDNVVTLDLPGNIQRVYQAFQDHNLEPNTVINMMLRSFIKEQLSSTFLDIHEIFPFPPGNSLIDFLVAHRHKDIQWVNGAMQPDLIVDFKYIRHRRIEINPNEIIQKLTLHNQQTKKGNYYLLIVISTDESDSYFSEEIKCKTEIKEALLRDDDDSELSNSISFLFLPLYQLHAVWPGISSLKGRMKPYAIEESYTDLPVFDKDDIQRGRWGGSAEFGGRKLSAIVGKPKGNSFPVELKVTSTEPNRPLRGSVRFFLHDSFSPNVRKVRITDGEALLAINAYEAFTVGAVTDQGLTKLELDLNTIKAPAEFKYEKLTDQEARAIHAVGNEKDFEDPMSKG